MRSSVSKQEIDHFSSMAADWWNENGKFRPLHAINPVRLQFIGDEIRTHFKFKSKIQKPFTGISILDCGCGGGLIAEPLARLGANVTGIDADPVAINVARDHAAQMGLQIDYRQSSIEQLAKTKSKFDVVLALEIVEHVADVDLFLQSLRRVLKPGGIMIVSTLNRTIRSFAMGIVLAEDILGWVPQGTHDWNKFLRPDELQMHLQNCGLTVQRKRGISFSPIGRVWRLDDNLGVNYILSAA